MWNAEPERADSLRGHLVGDDNVERPGGVAAHLLVVGLEQRHEAVEAALNAELRASESSDVKVKSSSVWVVRRSLYES